MEQKDFYALVAKMRDAQNHYFAAKRAKDWVASAQWFKTSRELEKAVDAEIERANDEQNNPKLF